jgi:flagellar biosynthetic protein FliQ
MNAPQVVQIGRELMLTALMLAAPPVIASLVVGLLVSILQTITSIQEQTLSFAPRLAAVAAIMLFTLPWSLEVLVNFAHRMFYFAAGAGS